jgi:hypothetical protein
VARAGVVHSAEALARVVLAVSTSALSRPP